MGKRKPRYNPNKRQNQNGTLCSFAESIPRENNANYIYCEAGYDATFCQGNKHKCKKAWYRSLARRSDRRKNIDEAY